MNREKMQQHAWRTCSCERCRFKELKGQVRLERAIAALDAAAKATTEESQDGAD